MNHTYLEHTNCQIPNCPVCSGHVKICLVCGGSTGRITSECPGKPMTKAQLDQVMASELDFKNGRFFNPKKGKALSEILGNLTLGHVFTKRSDNSAWVYCGRRKNNTGYSYTFVEAISEKMKLRQMGVITLSTEVDFNETFYGSIVGGPADATHELLKNDPTKE